MTKQNKEISFNITYGKLLLRIIDYEDKETRLSKNKNEDDCWCMFNIKYMNDNIVIDNLGYDVECIELEELYTMLEEFLNDKMNTEQIFEPIETSFKIRFFPLLDKSQDKSDKKAELYIYFKEPGTGALSEDSVCTILDVEDIGKIYNFIKSVIDNKSGE
jgi:hypothetical protein